MKISRLRLMGFKSFVEPTDLVIEPGLTGVVGPNGCGKSNLLEALRWVMGETSYKSMRASAMDDVIFSGTNHRPARNNAEVTIFLDNTERQAPADYNGQDEIEITRRIEREAGSAYRINGRDARARDIKILFEDASTGARSPALVRQGQIAEIVNSKPEQRRRILEDAAGIAGLHSRRHEAELRLKAAENNLARITDLLGQLKSQIESLKRQARQARRYKEISGDIRKVEALEMHLAWTEAQAGVDREEDNLKTALTALARVTEQESQALTNEARLADDLPPLRETEAARGAVVGRLNVERDNLDNEARRLEARQKELTERIAQFETDITREKAVIKEADEILERRNTALAELRQQEVAAKETEAGARDALKNLQDGLHQRETNLSELSEKTAEARARRQSWHDQLRERSGAFDLIKRRLAQLAESALALAAKAPEAAKLSETQGHVEALAAELSGLEEQTVKAEEAVNQQSEQTQQLSQAAAKSELNANALTTERDTLAKLFAPAHDQAWSAVIDAIDVAHGFEAALGAALGDDLDASTTREAPVHWRSAGQPGDDAPLPEDVQPLSDYVTAPAELSRRLAQIGVVDAQRGPALQTELRAGQRLVSREGDLWRWDGFTASAEGITPAAQRLTQRNRLQDVMAAEQTARDEADRERAAAADANTRLTGLQSEEQRLRKLSREKQVELTAARQRLSEIERAARETDAKMGEITGARLSAEKDLTATETRIAEFDTQLQNDRTLEDLTPELEAAQQSVRALRDEVSSARDRVASLEQHRLSRKARIEEHGAEIERWTRKRSDATAHVETLKVRLQATAEEHAGLADLPGKIDAKHKALLSQLQDAEQQRLDAADKLAQAENVLNAARQALRQVQNQVGEAREERAGTQARLEASRTKRQEQAARIRDVFNIAPDHCLTLAEWDADDPLPSHGAIADKLARMKADRERLGGVNLQADDELTVMSEQFDTMDAERADVEAAISKLRSAINKLNREGAVRLAEAFENVNRHFTNLFTTLFNGGEARLELLEGEDPLSGGLEIIAKPPGKKPTTLSLLSGGEQTLTALSLIFAVFLTNPAPICVLDEVDAPLDDANVDRFCTLMEKMARDTATRFLIITHHPMTMTRMNRLFGVTMAEKGVSQLVSVDLETAQSFREAG